MALPGHLCGAWTRVRGKGAEGGLHVGQTGQRPRIGASGRLAFICMVVSEMLK